MSDVGRSRLDVGCWRFEVGHLLVVHSVIPREHPTSNFQRPTSNIRLAKLAELWMNSSVYCNSFAHDHMEKVEVDCCDLFVGGL